MKIGSGQQVWLERSGPPHAIDDLILERFALTARILLEQPRAFAAAEYADPALIELLVSDRGEVEDRARAIRLLGLTSDNVQVVAVAADGSRDAVTEAVALVARDPHPVRSLQVADIDGTAALILQPRRDGAEQLAQDLRARLAARAVDSGSALSARIGIGSSVPAQRSRESWTQAQMALQFTLTDADEASVVEFGELGACVLLADVPLERLAGNSDVIGLERVSETTSGAIDIACVDALCRYGSLRQAAVVLHMHHSSVSSRIARIEDRLGWDLSRPDGILRARIALQARQLLMNSR